MNSDDSRLQFGKDCLTFNRNQLKFIYKTGYQEVIKQLTFGRFYRYKAQLLVQILRPKVTEYRFERDSTELKLIAKTNPSDSNLVHDETTTDLPTI